MGANEKESKPKPERLLPWVEKHRPSKIEEVAHQEEVTAALKSVVESNSHNLPHLLFYGPPGTGKTSLIVALAKQLFGPAIRERYLELNASDERGIAAIRGKVKTFSQQAISRESHAAEGYPCPPFKIIVLDEADSMTGDAQAALRRIMEDYSKTTRFVLICNYITRIIEPLASRCSKFRFEAIMDEAHKKKLREICAAEGVVCDAMALDALLEVSEGDLRRSITLLQSTSLLYQGKIDAAQLREVAGVVPPALCKQLLAAMCSAPLKDVLQQVEDLEMEGYGAQVLPVLLDLVTAATIEDRKKAACAKLLATADARLADGVNEDLQLRWVCTEMHKTLQVA